MRSIEFRELGLGLKTIAWMLFVSITAGIFLALVFSTMLLALAAQMLGLSGIHEAIDALLKVRDPLLPIVTQLYSVWFGAQIASLAFGRVLGTLLPPAFSRVLQPSLCFGLLQSLSWNYLTRYPIVFASSPKSQAALWLLRRPGSISSNTSTALAGADPLLN
ncbi:MAG: hypothetical protein OXC99_09410 [Chloroflexi bacterium]|nr:hypothetical protein [Chloroflexota bacterium]